MGLDEAVYQRITALCKEGDALLEKGPTGNALRTYGEALGLLPDALRLSRTALWIYAAVGDAHFQSGNFPASLDAFKKAVVSEGGLGNPFIHLRLGECHFELGDQARADDELTRAYMGAGREIFEDEDKKYFRRLQAILKPPAGSSSL